MRNIQLLYDGGHFEKIWHIVSEPGDMTRYDYYVIMNFQEFSFVRRNNNFEYPKTINVELAKAYIQENNSCYLKGYGNCNSHTIKECCSAIIELIGEENENN